MLQARCDLGGWDAIDCALSLFWLVERLTSMAAIVQDLGLDREQIGLDRGGATQTP
jgi:hypothetical protein